MAKKLIDHDEAARMLGVSAEELNSMRDRKQVFPKRDAGVWKYELDQIQRLVDERKSGEADSWDASLDLDDLSLNTDPDSIVLSDDAPGEEHSTVIGKDKKKAGTQRRSDSSSDVRLADSGELAARPESGGSGLLDDIAAGPSDSDKLFGSGSLKLADDINLGDSPSGRRKASEGSDTKKGTPAANTGSSLQIDIDDDELVLESKPDSDITIGGSDSGISLIDPHDSGLSLEQPLALEGSSASSFDLGEEDIISLEDEVAPEEATELKSDDDFLLTPMEDATDESDSSSQVIALDSEEEFSGGFGSSPAMLEEDLTATPLVAPGLAPAAALAGAQAMAPAGYVAEVPYSGWNITVLVICFLFMFVGGMFMYDLTRHMWSWGAPYSWTSGMMDSLAAYLP
jgi:hypothetical protein